jgi:RNA recognition motif-containing protein
VVIDRDTGKSRGFGFVQMPNGEEAQAAIAGLNGSRFQGRALTVSEARPRRQLKRTDRAGARSEVLRRSST